MKSSQIILGVAVGCGIAVLVAVLGVWVFVSWVTKIPEDVEVSVEAPLHATVGESFRVLATATNTSSTSKTLVDIDIADSYLSGIVVESATPPFRESWHVPIDNTVSYSFDLPIAAGESATVEFSVIAAHAGDFSGDFDFCVDSEVHCISQAARTIVSRE